MPMGLEGVAAVRDLGMCVQKAAAYHQVNPQVLAAILQVESRLRPDAVRENSNGTVDVGITQINSVHFPELARSGIAPSDLLNPCVGTFVGAWHLSKQIRRWGNTWYAVGAYHSRTPSKNQLYQVRVWNELVDMKAVDGPKLRVQK